MNYRTTCGVIALCLFVALIVLPATAQETVSNVTTNPADNATEFYNLGVRALSTNDYQTAIDDFNLALGQNTSLISRTETLSYLYEGMAYAQIQLKQYDAAYQTTLTGLNNDPKDSKLWNNKGYALYNLGKYQDAVTAYDQAIAIDGNYTSALINKGGALYKLGDYQGSIAAYQRALSTNPGNADATTGLKQSQDAAGPFSPVLIVVIIVVIVIIAGAVWLVKFRKPAQVKKPAPGAGKDKARKK